MTALKFNTFIEKLDVTNAPEGGYELDLLFDFRRMYYQRQIPYYFPIDEEDELFRYAADIYGIVYDEQIRNYSLWLEMGLKKTVSIPANLLFNIFYHNAFSRVHSTS